MGAVPIAMIAAFDGKEKGARGLHRKAPFAAMH
jgi:hypothetical protein